MKTALVVGDAGVVADYIESFTSNGYCVVSANSATAAFRCLEEFPCDVVVLTKSLSVWTRRAISEVAASKAEVICIGACNTEKCCGRGWISEDEPLAVLSYLKPKINQA